MTCPDCDKAALLVKTESVRNNPQLEVRGYICRDINCLRAFAVVMKKKGVAA